MNAAHQSTDSELHCAFQQFNKLSEQFTQAYHDLEHRFGQIKNELSDTKSKRLKELAEKEQLATRLHLLLSVLPMGVLVVSKSGHILEHNNAAEELLSVPLRNTTWTEVVELVFPKDSTFETSSICVNQRNLHISSQGVPNASDTLILINDVTEPLAHIDSLKRKERLAYLGNAIASIAHDIRTPLAASFLHLSNLDKNLKQNDFSTIATEKVRYSLKNLENTLNNMLAYAKGNADTFAAVDCKTFSEMVVKELLEYFPNTVLSMRSDENIHSKFIRVNTVAMITSLRNLITNAQQAGGSEVEVSIDISIEENQLLKIEVSDNGPGIKDEILDSIFEPFFTTKDNGTGLGLSIVKSIMESHKGRIYAYNHINGATIIVEIPLLKEKIIIQ